MIGRSFELRSDPFRINGESASPEEDACRRTRKYQSSAPARFADALKNRGAVAALICFLSPASNGCLWSGAVRAKPEEEQRPAG
ncbi:MAG: hypothetical protein DMF44_09455 [Verrucomicrobia bacterium]|nr:MAG: hypothetical protein DMF44_09455 [Verrucomicrobiota bacterium]